MPGRPGLDEETRALLDLTREIADAELRPAADAAEKSGTFPRQAFRMLGKAGLLGLPYPEQLGGSGQSYEVYLQVVEELASAWLTIGLGVSVHTLACYPLATAGSEEQQERWLPAALGGDLLGAYCLSEPHSGSDAAALRTSAVQAGDGYVIDGVKAWILACRAGGLLHGVRPDLRRRGGPRAEPGDQLPVRPGRGGRRVRRAR